MRRRRKIIISFLILVVAVFGTVIGIYVIANNNSDKTATTKKVVLSENISPKYGTYYQLLVYAFADSDGDGIGDFKGISEHLDYLKKLGITGIWLSPVNTATSYHGYDVEDYYSINSEYVVGKYDFDDLVVDCKKEGIDIIMDLVINHTSSENKWFIDGLDAYKNGTNSKYKNYYNFSDNDFIYYEEKYITHEKKGIQYESIFGAEMPDLNYDNEEVLNEMINVACYWMEKGIKGFRLDGVKHICLQHDDSIAVLKQFYSKVSEKYPDVYMVGEVWDDASKRYYESGIDSTFNFSIRDEITAALYGSGNFSTFIETYQTDIRAYNSNAIEANFMSNHDMTRMAENISDINLLKSAAALEILAPGNAFIYYGDEIALTGERSLNADWKAQEKSAYLDAAYRTPMNWNDGTHLLAEYIIEDTNGIVATCKTIASTPASEMEKDDKSILNYYRRLVAVKNKYSGLYAADVKNIISNENKIVAYEALYESDRYLVIHNTSEIQAEISIKGEVILPSDAYITSDLSTPSFKNGTLILAPFSSVVMIAKNKEDKISIYVKTAIPDDGRYFVAGLNDNWVADEDYQMENGKDEENRDGIYSKVISVEAGERIKITDSLNWYGYENIYGGTAKDIVAKEVEYDNMCFQKAGIYTIIFCSDTKLIIINTGNDKNSFTDSKLFTYDSELEKIYIIGEYCDWMINEENLMYYDEEQKKYYFDITLNEQSQIKIYGEKDWYGSSALSDESKEVVINDDEADEILLEAGTYKIIFDNESKIIQINQ